MSLPQQKENLRRDMRARRLAYEADNRDANALADIFLRNIQIKPNAVIASYFPFRDEIDVTLLTETLRAQGHKIALPVVVKKDAPLAFYLFEKGDLLIPNKMGIPEPIPTAPALDPDILLVPLLAFDKQRNRLGYGGGFYDRTIMALRDRKVITTVGIAYAFQQVAAVPVEAHDTRCDRIVTEVNVF